MLKSKDIYERIRRLDQAGEPWMQGLRAGCQALALLPLSGLGQPDESLLTGRERARLSGLGASRKLTFYASRLALKYLFTSLALAPEAPAWSRIDTLHPDGLRPALEGGFFVSVSHGAGLVLAAAAPCALGVDLEPVSPKPLAGARHFLTGSERELLLAASWPAETAATVAWTVKEAACKAFQAHLAQAREGVRITALAADRAELGVRGQPASAVLGLAGGRVACLVRPA